MSTAPGQGLGPDWVPGPDGVPFRRGARVIVVDDRDRVLLVRGHDVDRPENSWWFLVGGGIDEGETPAQAAVRELREESGIDISEADLIGPVLTRSATFEFYARTVRQDEIIFFTRVNDPGELEYSGWTEIEHEMVDELRWWSMAQLREITVPIYPAELPELVAELLDGWDGVVRNLGAVQE